MSCSPAPDGNREGLLSHALVELADTLVHDFDLVMFLQTLSGRCVDLFGLASAGVMLQDSSNVLQVIASSDERGRTLELMELQSREGPCLDAYRSHTAVQAVAQDAADRWPAFASQGRELGYQAYTAVPMRLRDRTVGALNLFSEQPRLLPERDLRDAQAMADVATIGLLNERAVREARLVAEQLQHALTSRVVLEQAKGVLAVKLDCEVDDAFLTMRDHARNHNLRLGDIARGVVDGTISPAAFARPRG